MGIGIRSAFQALYAFQVFGIWMHFMEFGIHGASLSQSLVFLFIRSLL